VRLSWDGLVAVVFASAAASEIPGDDNPLSTASDTPGAATRNVVFRLLGGHCQWLLDMGLLS